jgi:outer membrane lipoprotein-sorting protein
MSGKERLLEDKKMKYNRHNRHNLLHITSAICAVCGFCSIHLECQSAVAEQKTLSGAKTTTQQQPGISHDAIFKKIENYFNGLQTISANFMQVDREGRQSTGRFVLKRPNKMKLDYLDPATNIVIAKNSKIMHYNKELKEKSMTSAHSSPLSFFLDPVIKLRSNLRIVRAEETSQRLSVTFCKADEDIDGAITVVFSQNPFQLLQWEIFSSKKDIPSGNSIKILLLQPNFNGKVSEKEFGGYD